MKKGKLLYICLGVIALFICIEVACIIGLNSNNKDLDDGKGEIFDNVNTEKNIDSDTELARVYNTETSDSIYKEITIGRSQSAKINVKFKPVSGDIFIDLFGDGGDNVFTLTNYDEAIEQTYTIDSGVGKYRLNVHAENFTGSFDISWTVEDSENTVIYTSDAGYVTKYNNKIFTVEKKTNGDIFTLPSTTYGKPATLEITVLSNGDVDSVLKQKISDEDRIGDCLIGYDARYAGKFAEKDLQDNDDYRTYRVFCVELGDGKIMTVEQKWERHTEDEAELNKILESITTD